MKQVTRGYLLWSISSGASSAEVQSSLCSATDTQILSITVWIIFCWLIYAQCSNPLEWVDHQPRASVMFLGLYTPCKWAVLSQSIVLLLSSPSITQWNICRTRVSWLALLLIYLLYCLSRWDHVIFPEMTSLAHKPELLWSYFPPHPSSWHANSNPNWLLTSTLQLSPNLAKLNIANEN